MQVLSTAFTDSEPRSSRVAGLNIGYTSPLQYIAIIFSLYRRFPILLATDTLSRVTSLYDPDHVYTVITIHSRLSAF